MSERADRDPLAVQIGAREIYDRLGDVDRKVDRLMDAQGGLREAQDGFRGDLADHETRIRRLESGRWPLPALTVLIALAALVAALIPIIKGS